MESKMLPAQIKAAIEYAIADEHAKPPKNGDFLYNLPLLDFEKMNEERKKHCYDAIADQFIRETGRGTTLVRGVIKYPDIILIFHT